MAAPPKRPGRSAILSKSLGKLLGRLHRLQADVTAFPGRGDNVMLSSERASLSVSIVASAEISVTYPRLGKGGLQSFESSEGAGCVRNRSSPPADAGSGYETVRKAALREQ